MTNEISFHIYVCHAYLNTLYAGYQGKFARLKALSELIDDKKYKKDLNSTCSTLDNVSFYLDQLWKDRPVIFNLEEDDLSESALECIDTLYQLEFEISNSITEVTRILDKPEHLITFEDLAILCAYIIQRAYTREHYIQGLVQYAKTFDLPDTVERWSQHLKSCDDEINAAHQLFEQLQACMQVTPLLIDEIKEEALFIPALLECQIHDMNQVIKLDHPEFLHSDARVLGSDYHLWEESGIPAQHSGYWKAYGFHPHEVFDWMDVGFGEPAVAGAWFGRGFDPIEALIWGDAGYSPKEAFRCVQAGFLTPEMAEAWQGPDEVLH